MVNLMVYGSRLSFSCYFVLEQGTREYGDWLLQKERMYLWQAGKKQQKKLSLSLFIPP
jgi:hypothetical protein